MNKDKLYAKVADFMEVAGVDATSDEKYAVDLNAIECFNLANTRPQSLVSTRKLHYKNEYHDEVLTQVQLTIYSDVTGLGAVKKLAESITGFEDMTLRPAFIYQVVPAIEFAKNDIRFAAGGLIRPEVLRKKGLKEDKDSIYVLIFILEDLEKI